MSNTRMMMLFMSNAMPLHAQLFTAGSDCSTLVNTPQVPTSSKHNFAVSHGNLHNHAKIGRL